jgi:hypothetical protein
MNQIKITDLLGAEMELSLDYKKIKEEMLALKPFWIYTPPYKRNLDAAKTGIIFQSGTEYLNEQIDYIDENNLIQNRNLKGQYIFYLTEHKDNLSNNKRFAYTKQLSSDGWSWIDKYRDLMPYTIKCIEDLPYSTIGLVRVFVTENTFFPTHIDTKKLVDGKFVQSDDYSKCLGISIIPDTGNVPMSIWSFKNKEIYKIYGNAMLFNDSAPHGVNFTPGTRITIRIFGNIDFQKLEPYIKNTFY